MNILIKNKNWRIGKRYNINKILYLLIDRPDEVESDCRYIWKNKKGQRHRDYDLPAIIWDDFNIFWVETDIGDISSKSAIIWNY